MPIAQKEKEVLTHVPLIAADKAIISLRSSGHDYCSAVGEVIDNSLQANANNVHVRIFTVKKSIGKNKRATEVVQCVAMGDDGDGMSFEVLHNALKLGYSTRYNNRMGMGRFGVGAKLGGISQARRIDMWSRQSADEPWLHTYIDLDEIESKKMEHIPMPAAEDLPSECGDLVGEHGTLVVWSKADHLEENESGGGRSASKVTSDLVYYIARTFRKFLDRGITISLDGKVIRPHDPLFLMEPTRQKKDGGVFPPATMVVSESFPFPVPSDPGKTSNVEVVLSLLPEDTRMVRLQGGEGMSEAQFKDNEGISILRADREIFKGYLRDIQPSIEGRQIDRFIGKEIRFEPDLDECFQVRNVKKGAEPIDALRDKLKDLIHKTIISLRAQVSAHFDKVKAETMQSGGVHTEAEQVMAETQRTSRKPKAGKDKPAELVEQKIEEAAESLTKQLPEDLKQQKKQQLKEKMKSQPYTVVLESWPGREMMVIEHLGSTIIVKLNMQHPFYTELYEKLLTAERAGEEAGRDLAHTTRLGIDLLIAGYARAEAQFTDTSVFDDLRTNWGLELKTLIQHWKKL